MAESEHNVKINIKGDAHWAVGAFNRLKSTLLSVKSAVSSVMSALGVFGMAMQGIQAIIDGYKWLKDKIKESATEAARLRKEMSDISIAKMIERDAEQFKKLNKELERTVKLEKERRDILNGRRKTEEALDDANAELNKQKEISDLDPTDKNYADRKAEIERRYALSALDRKDKVAEAENASEREALREQARQKDRAQELKQREADAKIKTYDEADASYAIRWGNKRIYGTDDPEEQKQMDEDKKKLDAIWDDWRKINEEARKLGEEADSLRRKSSELVGGNLKEKIKNDAERAKIENDRREKEVERKREEEKRLKEENADKYKVEDATLKRQMAEEIAALDPKSKTYEFDRKEIERTYATKAAEDKVARAESETDKKVAEEELEALKIRNTTDRKNELSDAELKRADNLEPLAERLAAADGVSQNRLTAMGLGSGVSANGGVASDVRKLVDLLRQNVKATESINKNGDAEDVAVYGE